jgi:uncharacterized protein YpuA (DUF1002 family)
MENLRPIKVNVFYEGEIKKITKKDYEEAVISEGLNFGNFIYFIFSSYPNIQKIFVPGTVSFSLNNRVPMENDILKDGDIVKISAMKIEDIRKIIERRVSEIINHYQVDITFNKIKEVVFAEDGQEDFNQLIDLFAGKISDINELNRVLQIVNNVWNYFPHKCLGGLCPMEKTLEYQK